MWSGTAYVSVEDPKEMDDAPGARGYQWGRVDSAEIPAGEQRGGDRSRGGRRTEAGVEAIAIF